MSNENINRDLSLLKRIVSPSDSFESEFAGSNIDISNISRLIDKKLPEALAENAPANFPQLYFDFKHEFERFKEFVLFDKLIGKNIVSLGGGFSSGKSSFLNSIMGKNILPSDINPSTSVPAYIVNGKDTSVYGINTFGSRIELEINDVKAISHGFGSSEDDESEATLGHILDSIFISTPDQKFKNIALIDTPGYSKADSSDYSAKTDEKIARAQLNSSNYILWFIQADSGTITQEDINFLGTINKDIPKLIIVNKADKVTEDNLALIVSKIRDTLDIKGISYVDVLTYSRRKGAVFDKEKIIEQLKKCDNQIFESRFAYNFKVLFSKCKEYYDEEINEEGKRLNRLNKAVTLSENDVVYECLTSLVSEIQRNIVKLKELKENLAVLLNEFFSEIKIIADKVNISMPEPSEIDLIKDKTVNLMDVLRQYCLDHKIKRNNDIPILIADAFADIKPVFNKTEGNIGYSQELAQEIMKNLIISKDMIKFNLGG